MTKGKSRIIFEKEMLEALRENIPDAVNSSFPKFMASLAKALDTIEAEAYEAGREEGDELNREIEACGDDFWHLIKLRLKPELGWKATQYALGRDIEATGSTALEAVKALALALKK